MRLTEQELYNKLLEMLEYGTPYHYEHHIVKMLPTGGELDGAGNYWLVVGDEKTSRNTLFCAHMDTVGQKAKKTDPFYYNGKLYATNPDADCLGGDDRCGILCLIALYNEGVPGTYLFHVGEEKGTIGSKFVAEKYDLSPYKRAIQFDRRGTTSVITQMMGYSLVCSSDFAKALCEQLELGFKMDDGGSYTDVYEYQKLIPEVTNVSCGYNHEHSSKETIEVDWLIKQFIPQLYKVKWDELPVVRDPKADNTAKHDFCNNYSYGNRKYRNGGSGNYYGKSYSGHYDDDDYFGYNSGGQQIKVSNYTNGVLTKQTFNSFEEYIEYKSKQDPDYCSKYLTKDQQEVVKAIAAINCNCLSKTENDIVDLVDKFDGKIDENDDDEDNEYAGLSLFTEDDIKTCQACNEQSLDTKMYTIFGEELCLCESCYEFAKHINLDCVEEAESLNLDIETA